MDPVRLNAGRGPDVWSKTIVTNLAPILLLAVLVTIVLSLSILAGLRSWWVRRSATAPRVERAVRPLRAKATRGPAGLRALQEAGRARAQARNRAALDNRGDAPEKIGKAHRVRLERKSTGGPWS